MMKKLENEVNKDNEIYESVINEEGNNNNIGMRPAKDEEEIFFHPKSIHEYLEISGLNAMNYIKIEGEIHPKKFMNLFASKLKKELNCDIKPDFKKLKFKAIFPNKLKEELENEEELEEEEEEEEEKK